MTLASPTAIPAFRDNYIWALRQGHQCVVVDPGDAGPVENFLREHQLRLAAILITHHHADHVGGIHQLLRHRQVPVYGPATETIPGLTQALKDGDTLILPGVDLALDVLSVPGHTLGHLAYYAASPGWLFCGDTLFSGGCGRLFEGTPEQMYHSLQRLAALPTETQVYCTHEYTQANLNFAAAVLPDDAAVQQRLNEVSALRAKGHITLPSTLAEELRSNLFLRTGNSALRSVCEKREKGSGSDSMKCFAALRRWKDDF